LKVVGEARDGLEAVQKAIDLRADLVLMDIDLPKMNGLEAARRIGDAAQGARILFVTHINDRDVIAAALDDGACGYILKMDADAELLPAIRTIVRGERLGSRAKVAD
jgi:DNA-binding NarL/FixJ family response regulator